MRRNTFRNLRVPLYLPATKTMFPVPDEQILTMGNDERQTLFGSAGCLEIKLIKSFCIELYFLIAGNKSLCFTKSIGYFTDEYPILKCLNNSIIICFRSN